MANKQQNISPRTVALKAIKRIEKRQSFTDIVLSHLLNEPQLNTRDRAFISELVRGTIRWKKRLDWMVNSLYTGKKSLPVDVRWILWLGLYQIEFTRVPRFAAVNESVNLAKKMAPKWTGVINGVLRNYIRQRDRIQFPDSSRDITKYLAVFYSHPEWLVQQWLDHFGIDETKTICEWNNKPAFLYIRYEPCRIKADDLETELTKKGFSFEKSSVAGFYKIIKNEPRALDHLIEQGLVTVQDASAGIPALLANPQKESLIFDVCAAPGGKSMHLASLVENDAIILSGDVKPVRVRLVNNAKKRLSFDHIYPLVADAIDFPGFRADVVLCDAPCSGLGVLQRKPDLRWHRTPEDIKDLTNLQKKLICRSADLVKSGGTLIYATCTTTIEENEAIVEYFLQNNPSFCLDRKKLNMLEPFFTEKGYLRTWPHRNHMDGSFAAKLIRKK